MFVCPKMWTLYSELQINPLQVQNCGCVMWHHRATVPGLHLRSSGFSDTVFWFRELNMWSDSKNSFGYEYWIHPSFPSVFILSSVWANSSVNHVVVWLPHSKVSCVLLEPGRRHHTVFEVLCHSPVSRPVSPWNTEAEGWAGMSEEFHENTFEWFDIKLHFSHMLPKYHLLESSFLWSLFHFLLLQYFYSSAFPTRYHFIVSICSWDTSSNCYPDKSRTLFEVSVV